MLKKNYGDEERLLCGAVEKPTDKKWSGLSLRKNSLLNSDIMSILFLGTFPSAKHIRSTIVPWFCS